MKIGIKFYHLPPSHTIQVYPNLQISPFELIFGKPARVPSSLPTDKLETYTNYMQELINRMEDTKRITTKNLIKSKHRTKRYYDRKVKSCSYSPADLVYVLKEPRKNNLDRTYIGPYKIINILEKHNLVFETDSNKRILRYMDKVKPAYHRSVSDDDVPYSSDDDSSFN